MESICTSSGHDVLSIWDRAFLRMVFAMAPFVLMVRATSAAQAVSDLFTFTGANSSSEPNFVALTQGRDGKLYGTTTGLPDSDGSIFRLQTSGSGGVIHAFVGTDGMVPDAGLTLATDGNYYGTTIDGGTFGLGVLFRISPEGNYLVLHDFQGGNDGGSPTAPPVEASDGNLYGTTAENSCSTCGVGTVYKYTRDGVFTTIYVFDTTHGAVPLAPLLQANDGQFYATAELGGSKGCGAILKLSTAGTLLHSYSFPCGGLPFGPLMQASDGNFYGTTLLGGTSAMGTLFKMTPSGVVSILHSFTGGVSDGAFPACGLVQGNDGNLYGATAGGGLSGNGTLFQFGLNGAFTLIYSFSSGVGSAPSAALLQHTNGMFYGTTTAGGTANLGVVYSLNMTLGQFVTFVRSTGKVGQTAQILGQGLAGSTSVTFNGVPATSFSVVSDTYMTAVVPSGATTGPVGVMTSSGPLTSNVSFRISQ
jgi:uncharacterized repeat protein (TIGR03803 family)